MAGSEPEVDDVLGLLFRHSPVPQFVSRADGALVIANPAYAALVGSTVEAVVGSRPADVTHPDDLRALLEAGGQLLAGELELFAIEARVRRADGEERWCTIICTLARDECDEALFVCHLLDVTDRKRAEAELALSQANFQVLADSLPVGVHQRDDADRLVYVNQRWTEITGLTVDEALGQHHAEIIHPDDRAHVLAAGQRLITEGGPHHEQFRIVRPDGTVRWVSSRAAWLPGADGQPVARVGSLEDITSQLESQEKMNRLAAVAETTSDLVGVVDARGWVVWANSAARTAHGLEEVMLPVHSTKLYTPESVDRLLTEALPRLLEGKTWTGELDMYRHDAAIMQVWQSLAPQLDGNGELVTVSAVGRDTTERRRVEAELTHRATHDVLTGLPNRALLLDRLGREVGQRTVSMGRVAVLLIDLDRFKAVNDELGHDAGDDLLRAVADRLSSVLRPGDVVARLGGDEFVVLCPDVAELEPASEVAQRLLHALSSARIEVRGRSIPVTASIGIAVSAGGPDQHAEGLLREADAAMYRAKALGRARFEVFGQERQAPLDRP